MQTSRLRCALLGALFAPLLASAQTAGGLGDDARVLPFGAIRFGFSTEMRRWYERYGQATPGHPNGALQPLALAFNTDSLGAGIYAPLSPVQSSVRSLAAMPDFTASLGKAVVNLRENVTSTPFALELGILPRVTIGVLAPLVTATSTVDFRFNPGTREPTVGFNPAFYSTQAVATNSILLNEFDLASIQLNQRLTSCAAAPTGAGCASLNANAASARALIQAANAFATGVGTLYGGRNGGKGAAFVPIYGTAAQAAIEARVAAYRAQYATFGTTTISSKGPLPAQAPFTVTDAQTLFTDTTFGIVARPLSTNVTRGMGDVDFTLKVNFFDSFQGAAARPGRHTAIRQSFSGTYRLGTGKLDAPDDFADLGTGDHQNDIEVRSYTDIMYGSHFWVSLIGGYNMQMADERTVRILEAPDKPIAAAFRQQTVKRDLGDAIDLTVNPRWVLNDFIRLSGHYRYRRKFADAYTGTFSATDLMGAPVALDASVLNSGTEAREHRFGGGVTFSTVSAFERGVKGAPLEISYFHIETTRGTGGNVPKEFVDRVDIKLYWRLFGR